MEHFVRRKKRCMKKTRNSSSLSPFSLADFGLCAACLWRIEKHFHCVIGVMSSSGPRLVFF